MATMSQIGTESAQAWKDLLEDLLPPQGAWSEDEYLVLTEHSSRLVEYTDGFLEALPMPTDKHQSVLQFLFLAFFHHVGTGGGKVHFAPLRLQSTFRQVSRARPAAVAFRHRSAPARPLLARGRPALEVVSEDKPERDLLEKRVDYAEGAFRNTGSSTRKRKLSPFFA